MDPRLPHFPTIILSVFTSNRQIDKDRQLIRVRKQTMWLRCPLDDRVSQRWGTLTALLVSCLGNRIKQLRRSINLKQSQASTNWIWGVASSCQLRYIVAITRWAFPSREASQRPPKWINDPFKNRCQRPSTPACYDQIPIRRQLRMPTWISRDRQVILTGGRCSNQTIMRSTQARISPCLEAFSRARRMWASGLQANSGKARSNCRYSNNKYCREMSRFSWWTQRIASRYRRKR